MITVIVIVVHIQKPIFLRNIFIYTKSKKKSILFAYAIPRALLSNKIFYFILQIFNNLIATKLCVNLINNCRMFLEYFSALHNSMIKLCSAFFKCENKLKKLVEKINAQF